MFDWIFDLKKEDVPTLYGLGVLFGTILAVFAARAALPMFWEKRRFSGAILAVASVLLLKAAFSCGLALITKFPREWVVGFECGEYAILAAVCVILALGARRPYELREKDELLYRKISEARPRPQVPPLNNPDRPGRDS